MKTLYKHLMSGAITLLVAVGAVYLLFALLLYMLQPGMVYYPIRDITVTPAHAGMSYEEITFPTEDGLRLAAWYVPAENARGVILFCHGNAGNISHRLDSLRIFHDLGLSVFIFDYRGYGRSEGTPDEEGTYRDAKAAWLYLTETRKIAHEHIIFFGRSLGAAVAAWLARTQAPRGLILESVFTSAADLAQDLYPYLPARLLVRYRYDTLAYLKEVRSPVLIIHSRQDDIIPFSHGQKLFQAANEPKFFLELRGGHNEGFLVSGRPYRDGLGRFISDALSGGSMPATR